jgi:c-di-GMP-binding flagellar brake protein YcgR
LVAGLSGLLIVASKFNAPCGGEVQMVVERRRHSRVDSINLLTYSCYDKDDRLVEQGMGRTLNVSKSGILLETSTILDMDSLVYVTIAFDEDLVEIKGRVVRHIEGKDENFFDMGIEFFDLDAEKIEYLERYVELFLSSSQNSE